ncbi:hypothetical protein EDB19DRAFT_1827954 [Suillus lakei]|nr:hypothetical protein EDB19DRAFT_1827954 [Suillus lakei]
MVATRPSNKSKHLGKVDLPVSRQQNTEDSDNEDNEDDVRDHQLPRKKANRPPMLKVLKVPRKLSISALGDPADEAIIEDVMLVDNNQNNEHGVQNSDSPAGSDKPDTKLTKAQKVRKNVVAAKERAMEQQKNRAENEEDVMVADSDVDNVRGIGRKRQKGRSHTCSEDGENTVHPGSLEDELDNNEQLEAPGPDQGEQDPLLAPLMVQVIKNPPSNKAAQATSTATSTRPTPNEPPSHPPSHPPSRPPLDDEDMNNGEEQDDGTHPESESPRPYMWKFKVVGHTITCPTPKHQGSATNSMQPVRSKTGSGKSIAGDKTCSKDRGYGSNVDREHCNDRATGHQMQQGKYNPPSGKNDLPSGSHHNFDALIVLMWIDFISTLDNMWDISDFADEMQTIWDLALPNIKYTVSKLKDLVYKILMQHAYNYHSNFGEHAKYIEEQGWTSDKIHK